MFLAAVSLALALVYATAALGPIFQLQLAAEVEVVPTQCVESCSPVENIIRTVGILPFIPAIGLSAHNQHELL